MDCYIYCTALSYNLKNLFNFFSQDHYTKKLDTLVHVKFASEEADILFFSYGTFACWNLSEAKRSELLKIISTFEHYPLDTIEIDDYLYEMGDTDSFLDDQLILSNDSIELKIAFSHSLAQSAKLSTFETTMQTTFDKTHHIPEHLAKFGNIPLSRRKIRQQLGQLFIERSSINLSLDILDVPSFFWDYSEYETLYLHMANQLDLKKRTEVLNQQLDVLHDLFDMLGIELKDQHSHRLEWAIIYLIVLEVVILLVHDVLKLI